MVCPNCGKQLPDDAKFCSECGASVSTAEPVAGPPDPGEETSIEPVAQAAPPMRWFKFVIWVQLFLSALSYAITGVMMITGSFYVVGGMNFADEVYGTLDGLKAVDVVFGVAFVAIAVFALYVRQRLAGFRKGAPKLYLTLLGVGIAAQFLYAFAVSLVLRTEIADVISTSGLAQIIVSLLLVILNKYYFARRERLFTN